jgi:hypothetical protein
MSEEETRELIVSLVEAIVDGAVAVDFVPWEKFSPEFERDVMRLVLYETNRRRLCRSKMDAAQLRARGLLRSLLSAEQKRMLDNRRYFYVTGSAGGTYRLRPEFGSCDGVVKHGKNFFASVRYCFHDPEGILPAADVTIGQMLHILSDEADFLARANSKPIQSDLWDGEYLRRIRTARAARRAAEEEAA